MSTCGDICGTRPDLEKTETVTIIEGVAPVKMDITEGSEKAEGGNACKCTPSCNCNPCKC